MNLTLLSILGVCLSLFVIGGNTRATDGVHLTGSGHNTDNSGESDGHHLTGSGHNTDNSKELYGSISIDSSDGGDDDWAEGGRSDSGDDEWAEEDAKNYNKRDEAHLSGSGHNTDDNRDDVQLNGSGHNTDGAAGSASSKSSGGHNTDGAAGSASSKSSDNDSRKRRAVAEYDVLPPEI